MRSQHVLAVVVLGGVLATSATAFGGAGRQGSIAEPTLGQGRPPGPARGGVAPIFQGTFTHSGWRGSAPGICEDKDCGHLVAGRDGATGPTFDIFLPARNQRERVVCPFRESQGEAKPLQARVVGDHQGHVRRRHRAGNASRIEDDAVRRCTRIWRSRRGGSNDAPSSSLVTTSGRPAARRRLHNGCRRGRRRGQAAAPEDRARRPTSPTLPGKEPCRSPSRPASRGSTGSAGSCRARATTRRKGRVVRAGPDGAIGMQFDALPNAVIHPDGTFAFSAKVPASSGLTPHTITVRGTFYGNNVLGRVHGRSTKTKYDPYSSCWETSRSGRNGSANCLMR